MKDEVLQKALTTDSTVIPRYDVVRPDGTKVAENVQLVLKNTILTDGTALNKQSLLKDTTATAYKLSAANALPDDVLLAIRRSVSYCPKLKIRALSGTTVYVLDTSNMVQTTHNLSYDDTVSIDILTYGTYKIWGVLNNVATPEVIVDIDTTKVYNIDIGSFIAYGKFKVNLEVGAIIRARHTSGYTISSTVKADKTCTLPLFKTGTWTCTGNYLGCDSQSVSIDVTESANGTTIEKGPLLWTIIEVSVDHGSSVTITSGSNTRDGVSINGICNFWVPSAGTWNITATLNGKTATATAYPQAYSTYRVSMRYA